MQPCTSAAAAPSRTVTAPSRTVTAPPCCARQVNGTRSWECSKNAVRLPSSQAPKPPAQHPPYAVLEGGGDLRRRLQDAALD